MNAELISSSSSAIAGLQLFSPGQVLEKALGFDVAMALPKNSRAVSILNAHLPSRHGITPPLARNVDLPDVTYKMRLNIFFQYKRPEIFRPGHKSNLYHTDDEFMRFRVSQRKKVGSSQQTVYDQLEALNNLETTFGTAANVRYVCPSLGTRNELYASFQKNNLAAASTYVEPKQLLMSLAGNQWPAPPFHDYWTFCSKTLGTGIPNPDGLSAPAKDGSDFFSEIRSAGRASSVQLSELTRKAASLSREVRRDESFEKVESNDKKRSEGPTLWDESRLEEPLREGFRNIDEKDADLIIDALEVASLAKTLGLNWIVAEVS